MTIASQSPAPLTKEELTARFGSDEALGVTFATDDGETLTVAEYEAMFAKLGRDNMPDTESLLPHGGSAVCCTEYAAHIMRALFGRVRIVGFANEDNPDCQVVKDELHPGGHDFAIVDDRFLVDPWCKLVVANDWQVTYDLDDPEDKALALHRYGPRVNWAPLTGMENHVREELKQERINEEFRQRHLQRLAA